MHWNRLPTGNRIRVAGYVCYEPRAHATAEQIERKKEVFEKRLVATHVRYTFAQVERFLVCWLNPFARFRSTPRAPSPGSAPTPRPPSTVSASIPRLHSQSPTFSQMYRNTELQD